MNMENVNPRNILYSQFILQKQLFIQYHGLDYYKKNEDGLWNQWCLSKGGFQFPILICAAANK